MEEAMFVELLESVQQAKNIMKGEMEAERVFRYDDTDVSTIRKQFDLSQVKFAELLGISVGTLRNWEQGIRRPEGTARVLLRVASKYPDAIIDVNRLAPPL